MVWNDSNLRSNRERRRILLEKSMLFRELHNSNRIQLLIVIFHRICQAIPEPRPGAVRTHIRA